jgi:hypothetical protein
MRLSALLVTAILTAAAATAQPAQSSSTQASSSPQKDAAAKDVQPLDLPVSIDKIREALGQPPAETLKLRAFEEKPQFRVEINERQKIEELLKTLKFDAPAVPGGNYGYEQQRLLFPAVDNPLAQPYAAFSQGELLQVAITSLIEKYVAGRLVNAITAAERARAEQAAREEVQRAIAEYWAAQGKSPPPATIQKP